jgi:hypothetical protein
MSQKTKHNVVVVISATAVVEVNSDFNEQGGLFEAKIVESSKAPFLLSASPVGPPLLPEDSSAVSKAALACLAQKVVEAVRGADVRVEAAIETPPAPIPPGMAN